MVHRSLALPCTFIVWVFPFILCGDETYGDVTDSDATQREYLPSVRGSEVSNLGMHMYCLWVFLVLCGDEAVSIRDSDVVSHCCQVGKSTKPAMHLMGKRMCFSLL